MDYGTVSDSELIRMLKFEYDGLTPESQASITEEAKKRAITSDVVEQWTRNYYSTFNASYKCHSCGEELTLTTEELVSGQFVCPLCSTGQAIDRHTVVLKDRESERVVGGWLTLLCFAVTIGGPIRQIWTFVVDFESYNLFLSQVNYSNWASISIVQSFKNYFWAYWVLALFLTGYGAFAGYSLWRTMPGSLSKIRFFLYAFIVFQVLSLTLPFSVGLYQSVESITTAEWGRVIGGTLIASIWLAYLHFSRRVKAIFPFGQTFRWCDIIPSLESETGIIPDDSEVLEAESGAHNTFPESSSKQIANSEDAQKSPVQISTSYCAKCEGVVNAKFAFCPRCGDPVLSKLCVKCDRSFDKSFVYCPHCGSLA